MFEGRPKAAAHINGSRNHGIAFFYPTRECAVAGNSFWAGGLAKSVIPMVRRHTTTDRGKCTCAGRRCGMVSVSWPQTTTEYLGRRLIGYISFPHTPIVTTHVPLFLSCTMMFSCPAVLGNPVQRGH